jgi:hypothetical protein
MVRKVFVIEVIKGNKVLVIFGCGSISEICRLGLKQDRAYLAVTFTFNIITTFSCVVCMLLCVCVCVCERERERERERYSLNSYAIGYKMTKVGSHGAVQSKRNLQYEYVNVFTKVVF